MAEHLTCPNCESASVVYPDSSDDGPVICGVCGTFLATLAQYRQFLEQDAGTSGVQTTGC
jgi:transcription elongation factor Elf1